MTRRELRDILERAVWTAIQAFLSSFIVLLPGVLAAPNLQAGKALFTSALISAGATAASALKNYVKTLYNNRRNSYVV